MQLNKIDKKFLLAKLLFLVKLLCETSKIFLYCLTLR